MTLHDLPLISGIPAGTRHRVAELRGFWGLAEALDSPGRPFTSTEVVYGVTGTDVTELPEYGVSP